MKGFIATDEAGGQYKDKTGYIINVEQDVKVYDADPSTMYAEKMVDGKKKKVIKYGWEEFNEALPKAATAETEAEVYTKKAGETAKNKAKVDEDDG